MSVLFDLPPITNRTLACFSQCLKQMRATSRILSYGGLPPKSEEMIGVVAENLGHQRVGAAAEGRGQNRARGVDHENVALPLVSAQLVDLLLERRGVRGEQVIGQAKALPARIVAIETAFEVAGDRHQPSVARGHHPDRVQLEHGHAIVMHELPELGELLHERRDDLPRRSEVGEGVGDDEGLEPGQGLERHFGDMALVELFDVHPARVGQRHGRRAIGGRVGNREIDLVLGRHCTFEGDPLGLGIGVAVAVLGKVEAFLLEQRRLRSPARPRSPDLPFLPTPPLKIGLTKTEPQRSIKFWIWSSPASGPRTSALGKSTWRRRREP